MVRHAWGVEGNDSDSTMTVTASYASGAKAIKPAFRAPWHGGKKAIITQLHALPAAISACLSCQLCLPPGR